jgi:hypothetical protein
MFSADYFRKASRGTLLPTSFTREVFASDEQNCLTLPEKSVQSPLVSGHSEIQAALRVEASEKSI